MGAPSQAVLHRASANMPFLRISGRSTQYRGLRSCFGLRPQDDEVPCKPESVSTMATLTDLDRHSSAEATPRASCVEQDLVSLRALHEANCRNRKLALMAALSPQDLQAWQDERRAEAQTST